MDNTKEVKLLNKCTYIKTILFEFGLDSKTEVTRISHNL